MMGLAASLGGPVAAQNVPRPETLVQAWAASQGPRADALGRVELVEHGEWMIDGPFRLRRTAVVSRVAGGRGTDGWQREPVEVTVDGQPVPLARWQELDERRRELLGAPAERAARAVVILHDALGQLEPAGETVLDGRAWRVELVPRDRREPLERYTLWFDRQQGHLLRSRAIARARRTDRPLVVVTEYARVEGLDVPRRRHIEGSTQMKRRLRTYTILFAYEARYEDYRFFNR